MPITCPKQSHALGLHRRVCVALLLLIFSTLLLPACRTPKSSPAPPAVDLSTPGWRTLRGEAAWRPHAASDEWIGELFWASHEDGSTWLQFTKIPFPIVTAQTTPGGWHLISHMTRTTRTGVGEPDLEILWFQLGSLLNGNPPTHNWVWQPQPPVRWRLDNPVTGESLEGILVP